MNRNDLKMNAANTMGVNFISLEGRILQNSEVKKHKVFLKIKKDFTPSNANK